MKTNRILTAAATAAAIMNVKKLSAAAVALAIPAALLGASAASAATAPSITTAPALSASAGPGGAPYSSGTAITVKVSNWPAGAQYLAIHEDGPQSTTANISAASFAAGQTSWSFYPPPGAVEKYTANGYTGTATGPLSAAVSATGPQWAAGQVSNVKVTFSSNLSATVNWTPPASSQGQPDYYVVQNVTAGQAQVKVNAPATSATLPATGILPGHSYTFFVWAYNSFGSAGASYAANVAAPGTPLAPPAQMAPPTLTASGTAVTVSWPAATNPAGHSPVTGYLVSVDGGTPISYQLINGQGAYAPAIRNLLAGTRTVTIAATSLDGTGPMSAPASIALSKLNGVGVGNAASSYIGDMPAATRPLVTPVKAGGTITAQMTVTNAGNYQPEILGLTAQPYGAGPMVPAKWVTFSTPSLSLAPFATATITVTIHIPAGTKPALYTGAVFAGYAGTPGGSVTLAVSAGIRMYLNVTS